MEKYTGFEVAVIGMSGRFPGADTIEQYWENLKNGVDCIQPFTDAEALAEGESAAVVHDARYVKANAFLGSKNVFDADFFGYRPDEAELMDPQTRVYHECCWEALEDSGYGAGDAKLKVGLFASANSNVPWILHAVDKNQAGLVDDFTASHLRDANFLCSRISYKLNLKGPSVFVQTACSSSLVAIHEACNSLLLGECNMALAGGVNIRHFSKKGYTYAEGMILSKDGKCRPFDGKSSGTVGGEGAGVVVLKRLKDALRDKDHIYAVVKGTAINNDGNGKVGYTAPSVSGQAEVIQKAQKIAAIDPASISYVETHGTATELGDPVEIEALNKAFAPVKDKTCYIGSVKSNIGHLDSAAGVAGFIKTVLAIQHRLLPATLHFETPNPRINFANGPFTVNSELRTWDDTGARLRAGVSSFGIGGTNAHVVLEEAPKAEEAAESGAEQLVLVTGKTQAGLDRNTARLAAYLAKNPHLPLADVAYTLQTGRTHFNYRRAIIGKTGRDVVANLESGAVADAVLSGTQEQLQETVFLFPGQGAQYSGMCQELYEQETAFRTIIDECLGLAARFSSKNYRAVLFPQVGEAAPVVSINNTAYAQPALFMVEYALAKCLMQWGVVPSYMLGHSIGEYVAACVSGVLSLEDAVKLVVRRGELMAEAKEGRMLSVRLTLEQLQPLLEQHPAVEVAVINSANAVVVGGAAEDIAQFKAAVAQAGYEAKELHTSHAFHSRMMESILAAFEAEVATVTIHAPTIPYLSNVTGELVQYEQISQPAYWSNHLRSTVLFAKGSEWLLQQGAACFVEVGPGRTLINYVSESSRKTAAHKLLNLVRQPAQQVSDRQYLLEKVGQLWLSGINLDWHTYGAAQQRKRISLPAYAFEKTTYTADFDLTRLLSRNTAPLATEANEPAGYLHSTNWKRVSTPATPAQVKDTSLRYAVFSGRETFSQILIQQLRAAGLFVLEVRAGEQFAPVDEHTVELNPSRLDDYTAFWQYLAQQQIALDNIISCSSLSHSGAMTTPAVERLEDEYLTHSLLFKSVAAAQLARPLSIVVASNQLANVLGTEGIDPLKATLHGPVAILPSEVANVSSKLVDIPYPFASAADATAYVSSVVNELFDASGHHFVAYRFRQRWVPYYEAVTQETAAPSGLTIVPQGTYIITGAFGGMGFSIAQDLSQRYAAQLVLLHRSFFPPRSEWSQWLSQNGADDATSQRIVAIQAMESAGSRVELHQVDVANAEQVEACLRAVSQAHATINGLIWAAGEVDHGGIMLNRSAADFTKYTRSKIAGLLLFEQHLDFNALDFVSLFSSIGNDFYQLKFGQVAYNAANEFLANYARYAQQAFTTRVFAINWCDWLDVGMTVKIQQEKTGSTDLSLINGKIHDAVYPAEGVAIFHQCLHYNSPVYSIHKGSIAAQIKSNKQQLLTIKESLQASAAPAASKRADKPDVQQELTALFNRFFGKDNIQEKDDFFELGGDSLKAMTLAARINQQLGTDLTIGDIYRYPSVKALAVALQQRTGQGAAVSIPVAAPQAAYDLSFEQQRMYFLQAYNPGTTLYNETDYLGLEGAIDEARIEAIFTQLLQRHSSLRTSFVVEDGVPQQRVADTVALNITFVDGEAALTPDALSAYVQPFDLSCAPIYRVFVVREAAGKYGLVLDSHHIVMDGASKRILVEDFKKLYNNEPLPELSIAYKDYATWQRSDQQLAVTAKQKAFWLEQFATLPPTLHLPADYVRPLVQQYEGASYALELDETTTKGLKAVAAAGNTTLFTVLLAAYNILLSRLTNEEDIVVGTPVGGRQHEALEAVVGMFVNTLALRNQPLGTLTITEFIQAVKANSIAGFEHQSYPFEELVDGLQLERDTSRNPLFDVLFAYQKYELEQGSTPGLQVSLQDSIHRSSKFDLALSATEAGDKLYIQFVYATALFREETIAKFGQYFAKLAAAFVRSTATPLAEIDILSAAEKHQLLEVFNTSAVPAAQADNILSLFLQRVAATPEKTALVIGSTKVSYAQLDSKANAIAQEIVTRLGTQKANVGLLFQYSVEMVASVLAVIKTGCVYVPLSAEAPADRNRYILDDCQAALLLVQETLAHSAAAVAELLPAEKTVAISAEISSGVAFQEQPVKSDDPVYIIYTSGTTGQPKGVEVLHGGILNYTLWNIANHALTPDDATLQLVAFHFDGFGSNMYPILSAGGTMVMVAEEKKFDAAHIATVIKDEVVTNFAMVPTFYGALLDQLEEIKQDVRLRFVVLAGELAGTKLVQRSKALFPNVRLGNEYGPTEATIGATHNNNLTEENTAVIGVPIWNTQVYVLGRQGELLPAGTPGELCLAGAGLARGYLHNPALSQQRFRRHAQLPGAPRLYHTGDVCRWQADGTLLFVGRNDAQLKLRGFRIEPAEIEAQLSSYDSLTGALVQLYTPPVTEDSSAAAAEGGRTVRQLVAYYTAPAPVAAAQLQQHLRQRLPAYMVPEHFLWLAQWPLTPNGKVDRRALPAPALAAASGYQAPATAPEALLAQLWAQVLGRPRVGVHDDFFAAGGDSIKSIQISARLLAAGYEASVKDIFVARTIRRLAPLLRAAGAGAEQGAVVGAVALTPIQRWFLQGRLEHKAHFNQSVLLNFAGGLERAQVQAVFGALLAHHDALRLRFAPVAAADGGSGQLSWQQTSAGLAADGAAAVAVHEVDLRGAEDVAAAVLAHGQRLQAGLDLAQGPLLGVGLFHTETGSRLLVVVHHLVVDAVSWRILFEDIEQLYGQLQAGQPLRLPAKTSSFQQWANALDSYKQTSQHREAKAYWENLAVGDHTLLRPDNPAGANTLAVSQTQTITLTPAFTTKLLNQANAAFSTNAADMLVTALFMTVQRQFGLSALLVDMEGHGREPVVPGLNLNRTVGWFTTIFPVLIQEPAAAPTTLLRRVKETLRQVPNNGFDYLMSGEGEVPPHSGAPISFNYLGQFGTDIQDRVYTLATEPTGAEIAPQEQRPYEWDVAGIVKANQLEMSLRYSTEQYEAGTISAFMQQYQACLEELVASCCAQVQPLLSPSDTTYKRLTIPQLDSLQQRFAVADVYELSPMQEGLLFHSLLEPTSTNYLEQMTLHIDGVLDIACVESAMNMLVERHSILRTVFVQETDERPLQIVLKSNAIPFVYQNLYAGAGHGSIETLVQDYARQDRQRTFELGTQPPVRLAIFRVAESTYTMVWTHHHILMDGWCMAIILGEFREMYDAALQNRTPVLPPTTPYAEYIQWLRKADANAAATYWQQYLQSYRTVVGIPAKNELPGTRPYSRGVQEIALSKKQTQELQDLSGTYGITLNSILQAAWGLLLGKFNGTNDVVFGSVTAGRPPEVVGVETMIGLFINTLPVRVHYTPEETVLAFLQRFQAAALDSEEHQYYPLSDIQAASGVTGPLFETLIAFENFPLDAGVKAGNGAHDFDVAVADVYETNHYKLTLFIYPEEELKIQFVYDANKYAPDLVEKLLLYFKNIAEQLTADSATIADIRLLDAAEHQAVYNEITQYSAHPLADEDLVPASYHQERLWFIDQFEAGYLYEAGPTYHNIPVVLRLQGDVARELLEASLQQLLARHSILRTQIISVNGRPFQQLQPQPYLPLQYQELPAAQTDAAALIEAAISQPFQLDKQLLRALLIKEQESQFTLVLTLHHSITDRFSAVAITQELLAIYATLQQGQPAAAQVESLRYSAFALWQQQALSKLYPDLLSYWKAQLGTKVKELELPTDTPRAAVHIYQPAAAPLVIPTAVAQQAEAYALRRGVDMGVLLMAVFNVLLYKHAGHEEIVIGTPAANRQQPAFQELVGPATNLLVLKSFVQEADTLETYLAQVDEVYQGALQHQAMPFDKLVTEMAPGKDMSRTALFDVLYQYEGQKPQWPAVQGLHVESDERNRGYGKYDLNLFLQKDEATVRGQLVYNSLYFEPATIATFVAQYLTLLEALLAAPTQKIAGITPISAAEQQQLLALLDNQAVAYPESKTVIACFEEQVLATPHNVALSFEGQQLTYRQLNEQANALATMLVEKGLQAEHIVGLFTERSLETIVGMLAILKAGGAYLPLDIDYPEERIRYIVQDSGVNLIVTTAALQQKVPAGVDTIVIEEAVEQRLGMPFRTVPVAPSSLCYIIYTSGTTGNPKGVMVEHANVVRLLFNEQFQFQFGPSDVWTMFHSHCFDFSVWEIYGALLFGGKLVVVPKLKAIDTPAYLQLLKTEKVTVLNQTPSAFYNLIKEELATPDSKLALKYVIFGGEALLPAKLKAWQQKYPAVQLVNMFGITETTVHVTYKEIGAYEIENNVSNVGKPIPTLSVYILDQHRQLVPRGTVGELYVGGAGVARGYLGKPQLTAERFVAHPYLPGERLYKSGDLARILASGDIEYIGRIDNQVQLRGFRIELGEIESQMAVHTGIDKAVVLLKEKNNEACLVAYYVANTPLEAGELRRHLAGRLPDYMLPSYFVPLQALPLTANGKLDRQSLPDPEIKAGSDYQAPESAVAQELVRIWAEVLDIAEAKISVTTNFFELGGHSINLIKLNNKINAAFNTKISVANMFRLPTITLIEEFITQGDTGIKEMADRAADTVDEATENLRLLDSLLN